MTYSLLSPFSSAPDNVVSLLVMRAKRPRLHVLILSQPYLKFLMPSPVSVVAISH
jgi:hypothetical protein